MVSNFTNSTSSSIPTQARSFVGRKSIKSIKEGDEEREYGRGCGFLNSSSFLLGLELLFFLLGLCCLPCRGGVKLLLGIVE